MTHDTNSGPEAWHYIFHGQTYARTFPFRPESNRKHSSRWVDGAKPGLTVGFAGA
jgi:hypothetical protein